MIKVKGLRKVYRIGSEQVVALGGIDFEIPAGQICCIVGTSGSGKSTLLNQLEGLEKPTRGQVLIGGQSISSLSENELARFRQRNVGFIFQSYNLIPSMTALENVSMPLIFRGVAKPRREKAARKILKEVGLAARMRHTPRQMSGGQQQRVGIARAFVANPGIVFADEPTGNLDTATTEEVMRMMVRLVRSNRQTLVIVTHESEIAAYGDRVITLRDGLIVSDVLHTPVWNPEPAELKNEEPAGTEQANEEERGNRDETN
jgi:putative ABC transport system ATP-binding protein